jgi:hypothetical protein
MAEPEKKYYVSLDYGHRKYFATEQEAKIWVKTNPIIVQGRKNGLYHIYPSDKTGMGGHKKGNERLSLATKVGKQQRKANRKKHVVNTENRRQ